VIYMSYSEIARKILSQYEGVEGIIFIKGNNVLYSSAPELNKLLSSLEKFIQQSRKVMNLFDIKVPPKIAKVFSQDRALIMLLRDDLTICIIVSKFSRNIQELTDKLVDEILKVFE